MLLPLPSFGDGGTEPDDELLSAVCDELSMRLALCEGKHQTLRGVCVCVSTDKERTCSSAESDALVA